MKTPRTLPVLVTSLLLLVSTAIPLRGVVMPINWTGGGATGSVLDAANWDGTFTGTGDDVAFGDIATSQTVVQLPSIASLHNVNFTGAERPSYSFDGLAGSVALAFSGSLTTDTSGSDAIFGGNVGIALTGVTHSVDLVSNSKVIIHGVISDDASAAAIQKTSGGTLQLDGANTFSGGLDLAGGWLLLGNNAAAGTGTLTLSSGTLAPSADIVLANAIALGGSIKLGDCDTTSAITFSGVITGSGAFDAHGYGNITFGGNNSAWTGGIEFYGDNNVFVNHANGLGTGPVSFSSSSQTALHFNESSTISSLSGGGYAYVDVGDGIYDYRGSNVVIGSGKNLTINQDDETNTTYSGKISGSGDLGLTKDGAGALTLTGPVQISGPVAINGGTLTVDGADEWTFNSGAVAVNTGGTLTLVNSPYINNTVTVASGGKLTGDGSINEAIIQAGGLLSPGTASCPVGTMNFEDLTLSGLSTVVIGMKSDERGDISNSEIYVQNSQTLTLSGIDSTHKLALKLISDGVLSNLVIGQNYDIAFLTFNNQSGLLNTANVDIDPSGLTFDPNVVVGSYTLSLDGTTYMVSFTPVPEPSTYVLMALGLAGSGFAAWRRRRQA